MNLRGGVAGHTWLALLLAVIGCEGPDAFECETSSDCDLVAAGRCERNGFCSYPDVTCSSEHRYGTSAGTLADACIPGIFRSVGPGNSTALATGTGNPVSVTDSIATFSERLPDHVGVGDALQLDSDSDGVVDAVMFISERQSATAFEVAAELGGPVEISLGSDENWSIFRAHTSLDDAVHSRINPQVAIPFDQGTAHRDLVATENVWHIAVYADGPETTQATIEQWATSETYYLHIFAPAAADQVGRSQRHSGVWDAAKFAMTLPSSSNDRAIEIQHVDVHLEGIQIFVNTDGASSDLPYALELRGGPMMTRLSSTIIRGSGLRGTPTLAACLSRHRPVGRSRSMRGAT